MFGIGDAAFAFAGVWDELAGEEARLIEGGTWLVR
jgi:hypothetical protein